jgi:hypothetical protein|tara:strand:+ start:208 stop:507 length:300 start_codon:yes stop_codon:yes gene_type:complete
MTDLIDTKYKAPTGRSYNKDATITLITNKGKVPAQAGKILEALTKAPDHKLTVLELVGTDEAGKDSKLDAVGLNTVQTPNKIWSFYKTRLIAQGFISVS